MRHNGQRSASPFVRLASLAMHRLSFHADGDPVITDEVKSLVGKLTPDQFKTTFGDLTTKISEGAVEAFKLTLPKKPEKYEVKLPEGSVLPSEVLGKVTTAAGELGVYTNEGVQSLINLMDVEAKGLAQRIAADFSPGGSVFETQRQKYTEAALKASDLGNGSTEVLQAKVARSTAFMNKYFPDDVRKLINDTGIGNHPNFFRAMLKLADYMKEDGIVIGDPSKPKKSAADKIYGS